MHTCVYVCVHTRVYACLCVLRVYVCVCAYKKSRWLNYCREKSENSWHLLEDQADAALGSPEIIR